jgi:hypothetical protein
MRTVNVAALATLVSLGVSACGGGTTEPQGPAPLMSGVTPNVGTVGTELTVHGSNFRSGIVVLLDSLQATQTSVSGDTVIYASVPSGVQADTSYTVIVRNADGTQATLAGAFEAVAPVLQFVNSATKPSGIIGSTVIVEGDAFGDAQGAGQVFFSNGSGGTVAATIAAPGDWTNTFIVTTVPSGAGTGPISVVTGTGTSNTLTFTITQNATFSPSTINWTLTTDLPVAVSGHHALYVPIDDAGEQTVQYVFVTGGAADDSVPRADVNVATIQNDGSLGSWTPLTGLPAGRAFHRSVAATPFNSKVKGSGYLYVLGGIADKGGDPVTTIYRAALNNDGTIGTWSTIGDLPAALHSFGAVVFRSTIFVVGGATTGNAPVKTVYSASIDTLGNLSSWATLTSLPSARAYHALNTFGGYLYAVGGETATVDPNNGNYQTNSSKLDSVAYAKIDLRTDTLRSWALNGSAMQKARSKHTSLVAGGSLFVSAGLYAAAGTGSSENIYASLNADGSVGSFNGATGSNTLVSVGGADLFNQAAVVYQDAAGVAHVMILGGDNVNSPGTKQAKVLYY